MALTYYTQNGIYKDIAKYGKNEDGVDLDQYDFYIIGFCNYWNEKLGLFGDSAMLPSLVKAMMYQESHCGTYDGGNNGTRDVMQVLDNNNPAAATLARDGKDGGIYLWPNDGRIRAEGYGAVKNLFYNGNIDTSRVTPIMSICFGIRWFGNQIQNAGGNRAQGVTNYNGGGNPNYLEDVRRIMQYGPN